MVENSIEDHFGRLIKELSCSICLSVMDTPVARLPCCHYFCMGCISESIRHALKCPVCKTKATRRDIAQDSTMDRVVTAFKGVQMHRDQLAGVEGERVAIPWLQGVADEQFQSPSKSLSGTAMENMLKNRAKNTGSALLTGTSPPTIEGRKLKNARRNDEKENAHVDINGLNDNNCKNQQEETQNMEEGVAESPPPASSDPVLSMMFEGDNRNNTDAVTHQLDAIVAGLELCVGPTQPSTDDVHEVDDETKKTNAVANMGAEMVPRDNDNKKPQLGTITRKRPSHRIDNDCGDDKSMAAATMTPSTVLQPKSTAKTNSKQNPLHSAKRRRASEPNMASQQPNSAQGSRRIPTRLAPWNCAVCTFENKGTEMKCDMCETARGGDVVPVEVMARAQENGVSVQQQHAGVGSEIKLKKGKREGVEGEQGLIPCHQTPRTGLQQRKLTRGNHSKNQKSKTKEEKTRVPKQPIQQQKKSSGEAPDGPSAGTALTTKWAPSFVLLGSGLDSEGRAQLRTLAEISGATIADKWNPKVTHVICGTTASNSKFTARRTFKYLMGTLHGNWIVNQDWMTQCIASKEFVDESSYQITKDSMGSVCGASAAKTALADKTTPFASHQLMRGFEVQLQGDFSNKSQIIELLKAAGAKVVVRLPAEGVNVVAPQPPPKTKTTDGGGAGRRKKSRDARNQPLQRVAPMQQNTSRRDGSEGGLVLVEVPDGSEAVLSGYKAAVVNEQWYIKASHGGVPVVSHRWVTDCISNFSLSPLNEYLIN